MKKYLSILLFSVIAISASAQKDITVFDENTGKEETISLPEGMLQEELDSILARISSANLKSIYAVCRICPM